MTLPAPVTCTACQKEFRARRSNARFCSPRCRVAFHRQEKQKSALLIAYCEGCGAQYLPDNVTTRFCSAACKQQWYRHRQQPPVHRESPINLNDYDYIHLGISGGKDSTALLLWALYESGADHTKIRATFCDTGNEDSLTYAYVAMLSQWVFPIEVIKPARDFYELARHKKRFPSTKARFCTQHLKVIPCRDYLRGLLASGDVVALNGVRAAESLERSRLPVLEFDAGFRCDVYRPLLHAALFDIWRLHRAYLRLEWVIDLVRADANLKPAHKATVIKRLQVHGIPRNPLYEMGASRVGCYPCINSRKLEIRAMSHYRPERIAQIAEQEVTLNPARGGSTFFPIDKVPDRFKTRVYTAKDGAVYAVPSIHDVVGWAATGERAQETEYIPPLACELGGMCE